MKSPVATREGGAAGQGGSEESEDPERTAVEVAARVLSILTPNHDAAAPASQLRLQEVCLHLHPEPLLCFSGNSKCLFVLFVTRMPPGQRGSCSPCYNTGCVSQSP